MSSSEDPTRGAGTPATSGEDPMGTGRADVTVDPTQGVGTGATSGEDPIGTGRADVTVDPTQGAEAGEQPSQDPTQGSEPNASRPEPTHEEISVRA